MRELPVWKKAIYYVTLGVALCATILVLSELLLRASAHVPTEDVHTISEKYFGLIPGPFDPGQNILVKPHPKLIYHLSTNSLGYRGPEISRKKKPGTLRILSLGDSHTFGQFVNDDQTFPHYLEEMFVHENLPVEVVNGGVPGTTIVDQLYYLRRSIGIEPDIVILVFSENDIDDLGRETPLYLSLEQNRKLKSSGIIGAIYEIVKNTALFNFSLLLKAEAEVQLANMKSPKIAYGKNGEGKVESLWKEYENYLSQMNQYLKERQVRFVFTTFPSHQRIGNDVVTMGPFGEQLDRVENLSRGMGIPTIRVLPELQNGSLSKYELYLLPYDGHASAKGYFIQADILFKFLKVDVHDLLSSR